MTKLTILEDGDLIAAIDFPENTCVPSAIVRVGRRLKKQQIKETETTYWHVNYEETQLQDAK